jgi:hypothetical protein
MIGIWLQSHEFLRQGLIEEYLTSVYDVSCLDGTIASNNPICVGLDMDVDGTIDLQLRYD